MSYSADEVQWFYLVGDVQAGPFPVAQMADLARQGAIGPDTLVWTAGMADWVALSFSPLAATLRMPAGGGPGPGGYTAGPPPGGPRSSGYGPSAPHGAAPYTANPYAAGPQAGAADDFAGAVRACLSKYATFTGRARRPELWYFVLFGLLANIAAAILDGIMSGISGSSGLFGSLVSLGLLLPYLAVGARRLHDSDRSAWWLLIALVPFFGFIVLIVLYCLPGTPGRNRFG